MYGLLGRAFPGADPAMFVAQTERDRTFRVRYGRVAVGDGGRVIGWVRIFRRQMTIRGEFVAAGGLGQVAADAEARGSGVASALLRDAIEVMRDDGMAVSFLFTGIPALYEQVGYRIVREPFFEFDALEAAELMGGEEYAVTSIPSAFLGRSSCDMVARSGAGFGETGRIVRRMPSHREPWDEERWLGEDRKGRLATTSGDMPFTMPNGYIRCAVRGQQYQILEAEALSQHPDAMCALVRAVAKRALEMAAAGEVSTRMGALAPDGSRLAAVLRGLRSTTETTEVAHPMMMRSLVDDPAVEAAIFGEPVYFWNTARI